MSNRLHVWIFTAVVLGSILAGGCVSTRIATRAQMEESAPIAAEQAVAATLGPKLSGLQDEWLVAGKPLLIVPTGEYARLIFNTPTPGGWSIELVTSQLTIDKSDSFPIPAFATKAQYSISVIAREGTRAVPLTALGVGETSLNNEAAASLAIRQALTGIAAQLAELK